MRYGIGEGFSRRRRDGHNLALSWVEPRNGTIRSKWRAHRSDDGLWSHPCRIISRPIQARNKSESNRVNTGLKYDATVTGFAGLTGALPTHRISAALVSSMRLLATLRQRPWPS